MQVISGWGAMPTQADVWSRAQFGQANLGAFQQHVPQPLTRGALQVGAVAQVGQHTFRITHPLGKGSFSSVWAAVRTDGSPGEVAVKETLCRSQTEVKDAENEGWILQQIGGASNRLPELFAIETTPMPQGNTSVCVAMSRVPGESLGACLNRWKQQQRGVPLMSTQAVAKQFAEACTWGHELISQLLPAFEAVSQYALHRDVNTHNVLVNTTADLANPQFGLIDFGLAIQMQEWPTLCTQVPVVGDCRYWPVSAWHIFASGGPELVKQPVLLNEYRTQLDLHALGVTALQIFLEMLPQPPAGSPGAAMIPEEFRALKCAWERYWQNVYKFWEPLFHAFERKTDWNQLRKQYRAQQVHLIVGEDLANVRLALSRVRDACAPSDPGRTLICAMLELISQGGTCLIGEASGRAPTWQSVRAILGPSPILAHASRSSSKSSSTAPGTTSTTPMSIGSTTARSRFASHMPVSIGTTTSISGAYASSTTAPRPCATSPAAHRVVMCR